MIDSGLEIRGSNLRFILGTGARRPCDEESEKEEKIPLEPATHRAAILTLMPMDCPVVAGIGDPAWNERVSASAAIIDPGHTVS